MLFKNLHAVHYSTFQMFNHFSSIYGYNIQVHTTKLK